MKNRKSNKTNNKDIVNVKVKESIDLTSPLTEILEIKHKLMNEGKNLKKQLNKKENDLDKKLLEKKKEINDLKDSFDKVIQKVESIRNQTTTINEELNKKKDTNTQEKVNMESNKIEIEKQLTNLSKDLQETEKLLNGKKDEYRNYIIEVLLLHNRLQERVEVSNKLSKLVNYYFNDYRNLKRVKRIQLTQT